MSKVIVGRIVNTCGLKGEVKVINSSDFKKERYKKGNVLNIVNEEKNINIELTVSSYRENDRFIYLKFKEINNINEAENYKESYIMVEAEESKDDDVFYHHELLNMTVYYNEKELGIIEEISDNGRQDLIRVVGDNINILIPFMNEFIEKIDVNEKKIILKNLEGLLWK